MKLKKENWELTRKKGFVHFLLVRGFLFFGLPFTFIQILFLTYEGNEPQIVTLLLSGIIASLIYGFSMWHFAERKYKKENSKEKA